MKKYKNLIQIVFIIPFFFVLVLSSSVVNATETVSGGKVTIKGTEDPGIGVLDPEKQKEADPGEIAKTQGPIRIDFAPQLTFAPTKIGKNTLEASAYAQLFHGGTSARGNFVQISDYRGSNAGWNLMVRQEQQFQHETQKEAILKGAIISFDHAWTNSTKDASLAPKVSKEVVQMNNVGETYPLADADFGKGMGTWSVIFGASKENTNDQTATLSPLLDEKGKAITDSEFEQQEIMQNSAVKLTIPGSDQLIPGNYSTVLTWIIAELP